MASKRLSLEMVLGMNTKQVTAGFKRAGSAVSTFSKRVGTQIKKANFSISTLNGNLNNIGSKLINSRVVQVGLASLAVGAGLAAREFVRFDDAITASSAKFKGLNLQTKQGQQILEKLKVTAREVAAGTQFSPAEAAKGLDFLAMAGFDAEQAMVSLPGVVDLATVANLDLATSTDIASDALGAYGLMTDNTAQLQKNLNRVNDVAAKTTTMFNTDLVTLFETIKKGAPTFTNAGQSMESFSALAGAMANAGIKGSESGTVLRNVMLRLSKPTKEAGAVIDKLGIKTQDSKGNFLDVIDILEQFEKSTNGMGTAQRSAALSTVFGARAIGGVNILLGEGSEKLREYREELINSSGAASNMADIMRDSLGNRLKMLQSAAIEFAFKFFEAFDGEAKDGVKNLTDAIAEFNVKPLVEGFKAVGAVLGVAIDVIQFLSPLLPFLIGGLFGVKVAFGVAAVAAGIFNTVLSAGVLGIIILVIAAVVGLAYYIIKNWDTIKAKTIEIFGFVLNYFKQWGENIKSDINSIVVFFTWAWDTIKAKTIEIITPIINHFIFLKNSLMLVVNSIVDFFASAWDSIKSGAAAAGEAIKAGFFVALDFVKKILFTFADYFLTIWGTIIKGILFAASKVGSAIGIDTSGIDNIINKVSTLQQTVRSQSFGGDAFGQAGTTLFASPESAGIANGSKTVTQNGEINVNIGGEGASRATVDQKGGMPSGLNVNLGGA